MHFSISYKPFDVYLDHLILFWVKTDLDFWPSTNKFEYEVLVVEILFIYPDNKILERKFLYLICVVVYFLSDFFCDSLLLWKKLGPFADSSVMSGGLFSLSLSSDINFFSANVTFTNSSNSWSKLTDSMSNSLNSLLISK